MSDRVEPLYQLNVKSIAIKALEVFRYGWWKFLLLFAAYEVADICNKLISFHFSDPSKSLLNNIEYYITNIFIIAFFNVQVVRLTYSILSGQVDHFKIEWDIRLIGSVFLLNAICFAFCGSLGAIHYYSANFIIDNLLGSADDIAFSDMKFMISNMIISIFLVTYLFPALKFCMRCYVAEIIVIIERKSIWSALLRSGHLCNNFYMRIFGNNIITMMIVVAGMIVTTAALSAVGLIDSKVVTYVFGLETSFDITTIIYHNILMVVIYMVLCKFKASQLSVELLEAEEAVSKAYVPQPQIC